MKKYKKLWISLLSLLLAAALVVGVLIYLENRPKEPVHVYDINLISYSDWDSSSTTGGSITTDKFQAVHLSDTQMVTDIHVRVGEKVSKGTKLLTYDTTISQLALDRKKLAIQRDELRLEDAKAELSEIRNMKPIVYIEKPDKPSSNSSGPKGDLGEAGYQIYTGKGTKGSPARVWVSQNIQFTNEVMDRLLKESTGGTEVYLVAEYRQNDSADGEVTNRVGMHITQIITQIEVPPPSSEEPTTSPTINPSEGPTDPSTDPTEPSETSNPTGATDSTETSETAETTEPVGTESVAVRTADPETEYIISFFVPSENAPEPEDEIIWNSGFTAAEIAQKKVEKEREIKDLTFSIQMAKSELAIMQKEFDNGEVTSEISGHVVSVISAEEAAQTGEPIIKVSGGGGFLVQGSVSELNRESISIGQKVTVTSYSDWSSYEGTIVEIGDYPVSGDSFNENPNNSYYPFTVSVSEEANLQDGYYAEISYNTNQNQEGTFFLESAFILTQDGKNYVYVKGADGLLEKREIRVGATVNNGSSTKILSGLTLTDCIAFPYGTDLQEGSPTELAEIEELYQNN